MKDLIAKIFAKRQRVEECPAADKVIQSLKRLAGNEDFQLIRALILCYHADCVRLIANCQPDMVELIRGQMNAYDRVFTMTGDKGIAELEKEIEQKAEVERLIGLGISSVDNSY